MRATEFHTVQPYSTQTHSHLCLVASVLVAVAGRAAGAGAEQRKVVSCALGELRGVVSPLQGTTP